MKKNRKCVQTLFFDERGYFEISVFEILRVSSRRKIRLHSVCQSFIYFRGS